MKIRKSQPGGMKMALLGAAALAVCSASSQATTYYLQSNTGNTDWTTNTSVWWDQSSGGGNHPANAAALSGQDFQTNGFTIIATNGTNTFPGASLLINGGGVRMRGGSTNTTTVPNATATGGGVIFTQDTTGVTFSGTTFNNQSGTTILRVDNGDNVNPISLNVSFGTLTGSGNFALDTTSGVSLNKKIVFSATTATAWVGNLTWNDGDSLTLEFGNGLVSGGGLVAPSTARITLNQNVTFASVTIAGNVLTPGTYTFAQLNSAYDTIFNDGGSGSITIAAVPEPVPAAFVVAGLGLAIFLRRRVVSSRAS